MRFVSALVVSMLAASSAFAANIGEAAPSFKAMDVISGKEISSESLKGKTVVLEWSNFDCPFVKKFYSVGAMQSFQAAATKDGVVWVSINSGAAGKQGHFADAAAANTAIAAQKSNASHYVLDSDGVIGKAYGAKTTPHMFIVDAKGTLVYQGAIDNKLSTDSADIEGAKNYVNEALAAIKTGAKIETASTTAYGCGVKY